MSKSATSWQPGQSGNPGGRPKRKQTVTAEIHKLLRKRDMEIGDTKITRRKAIAEKLIRAAINGDLAAVRLVLEYIDGRPAQQVNLGGALGVGMATGLSIEDLHILADGEDIDGR